MLHFELIKYALYRKTKTVQINQPGSPMTIEYSNFRELGNVTAASSPMNTEYSNLRELANVTVPYLPQHHIPNS